MMSEADAPWLAEEESRCLASTYDQPVKLYIALSERADRSPLFLPRTLCYDRLPRTAHQLTSGLAIRLACCGSEAPLSAVTVLCDRISDVEFVPMSAAILHVSPTACDSPARVELPLSAAAAANRTILRHPDIALLLLVREGYRDLSPLKRQGAPLSCHLDQECAFGLLPAPGIVSWAMFPVGDRLTPTAGAIQPPCSRIATFSTATLTVQHHGRECGSQANSGPSLNFCPVIVSPLACDQAPKAVLVRFTPLPAVAPRQGAFSRGAATERGVNWKYIYARDGRHMADTAADNRCTFCNVYCCSFTALQLHLEASHERFTFQFSGDQPGTVPEISVEVVTAPVGQPSVPGGTLDNARKNFSLRVARSLRGDCLAVFRACAGATGRLPRVEHNILELKPANDNSDSGSPGALLIPKQRETKGGKGSKRPKFSPRKMLKRKANAHAKRAVPEFYHSRNATQCTPAEDGADSDDETDWLEWERRTLRKLEERVDINITQREFMYNWNSFLNKDPINSDAVTERVCKRFTVEHAEDIAQRSDIKELFIEHLVMLWDHNLMTSEAVDQCLQLISKAEGAL